MSSYLSLTERNLKLSYVQSFFHSLLFFLPIWYAYQIRFAPIEVLGLIYAVINLVSLSLELPTGALADLIGRKKTIFLGLTLEGVAWIIIAMAKDVTWLWVGYVLSGVSAALVSGSDTALIYDSVKALGKGQDYSKYSTTVSLIIRVALIIAIFFGGYIFKLSPGLPYLLVGISVICSALIGLWFTEPQIDTNKFSIQSYLEQIKEGTHQLFQTPHTTQLAIFYILVGGITWYYMFFLNQVYATEVGFTAIERGWIFSGIYLLSAILLYFTTHKIELNRMHVYLGLPLIMIIGFIPAYFVAKIGAIFSLFLIQIAGISRFAILDQYTNQEFASQYRATAISALNMGVSIFFIIISAMGGKVIALIGSAAMMSVLGVVSLVIVLPTAYRLIKLHNKIL